jgi:hypothetical protein
LKTRPRELAKAPQPQDTQIEEYENSLVRTQAVIDRLNDMASDITLQTDPGLKENLKTAILSKESIIGQIKQLKDKAVQIEALPFAAKTLSSMLSFDYANQIQDANKWMHDYLAFNSNQDNRKTLRNLMPSIFERVTLKHSKKDAVSITDIACTLVSLETINTSVIKTKHGIIFPKNDPDTKKPASFRLLRDGTRILIE